MISSRGRPLSPETKKAVVSVKQYFDGKKFQPMEPSVKQTADALGIGVATVKRIMADYNLQAAWPTSPCCKRHPPGSCQDLCQICEQGG